MVHPMASGGNNDGTRRQSTALDFATHTVWGDELSTDERNECVETLRELVEAFGEAAILRAVSEVSTNARVTTANAGAEPVMRAVRAFCVLIEESDKPRLTARLIGKLVHWDVAGGKRISYRELARDWGTSKQAVHNKAKVYRERLDLPNLDSTDAARESHRMMNRRNYGHTPSTNGKA